MTNNHEPLEALEKESVNEIAMKALVKLLEKADTYTDKEMILEKMQEIINAENQIKHPEPVLTKASRTLSKMATSWFFWTGLTGAIAAVGSIFKKKD